MIKLEHVVLSSPEQMAFVVQGLRNPFNSWDMSDSVIDLDRFAPYFILGDNDLTLMKKLSKAGTDHRKYMRMIPIMVRITAPLYWWKEFDTYKVGTVSNSCSTMHKIHEKEFKLEDFSTDHLSDFSWNRLNDTIEHLNMCRNAYLDLDEELKNDKTLNSDEREELADKQKEYWWQMIQLLPSSYNQTRNVMLNYEVLANIYHSRKGHKLDEWHQFCGWIETLPYSEIIVGAKK